MVYNPELVKQLLGEQVAELFDGTIKVEPASGEMLGELRLGDKLTFKFKNSSSENRQFIITSDIKNVR